MPLFRLKRVAMFSAAALAISTLGLSAFGQDSFDCTPGASFSTTGTQTKGPLSERRITVYATGEVAERPNVVTVTVQCNADAPTLPKANELADSHVDAIYSIADKSGLYSGSKREIATSAWGAKKESNEKPAVFRVQKTVSLKLKADPKVLQLVSDLSDLTNTEIPTVEYFFDNESDLRDRARVKAFENARKSAELLAQTAGCQLGDFEGVVHGMQGRLPASGYYSTDRLKEIGSLLVDSIPVSESLSVTFKLKQP